MDAQVKSEERRHGLFVITLSPSGWPTYPPQCTDDEPEGRGGKEFAPRLHPADELILCPTGPRRPSQSTALC